MAKYPVLFAGQRFTASLASSMEPDYYRKTTTTTRTSTTALLDDPDLVVPVVAGGIYIIEFYIKYAALLAAGFKTQWGSPAGTTGNRNVSGLGTTAKDNVNASPAFSGRQGVHGYTVDVVYGSRDDASAQVWCYEWAEVTVSSIAGNMTLKWAQNTSNATGSSLNAGSFARSTRIG